MFANCTIVSFIKSPVSQRQRPPANGTKSHLFCTRDLDLDPMTLIYKLDLDMLKTRTHIPKWSRPIFTSKLSKLRTRKKQTDRHD